MTHTNKKLTNIQRIAQLEKEVQSLQLTIIGIHTIMQREGLIGKKEIEKPKLVIPKTTKKQRAQLNEGIAK